MKLEVGSNESVHFSRTDLYAAAENLKIVEALGKASSISDQKWHFGESRIRTN